MSSEQIDIAPYQDRWAGEGLDQAEVVATALGELAVRVDHVGSTAVPGLAAKDVIDIQAQVMRLDSPEIERAMAAAGYQLRPHNTGDPQNPDSEPMLGDDDWRKLYFREPVGSRRIHIHVRRNGAAGARNTLLLRDFLRADSAARRDYGDFKWALADRTRDDRAAYAAIKRPFILTAQRAAVAWARRTRWVPPAPDVYWTRTQ